MISAEGISIMENSCAYFGRAAGTKERFQGGKDLDKGGEGDTAFMQFLTGIGERIRNGEQQSPAA